MEDSQMKDMVTCYITCHRLNRGTRDYPLLLSQNIDLDGDYATRRG